MNKLLLGIVLTFLIITPSPRATWAEEKTNSKQIKIGFIGSLSSFAANYGTAVLEGAKLAVDELQTQGIMIDLQVEDDGSVPKNTALAYSKLKNINQVQGILGGSWWINSIVKQSEKDKLPLISCETLYNKDVVLGENYFLLQGDLREWINIYEPLILKQGWKKGAIIRYTSGFGATLAESMKAIFSKEGREFVGELEYTDINIPNASDIILKLKKLNPDVVYVDGQPAGLATILKKLKEAGLTDLNIITNSIATDVQRDKLADLTPFKNIYYSKRSAFDQTFTEKFQAKYHKDPYLNADLGYYAMKLLAMGLIEADPISKIKSGIKIGEYQFIFNDLNLYAGIPQVIHKLEQ